MRERAAARVEGLIVGHSRDGRCRYSEAGKLELIRACLQPGVSVAGSALANGVNANLLRKWIQQYRREQGGKALAPTRRARPSAAVLLPVKLSESETGARVSISAEPIKPKALSPEAIEIDYAGARIVCQLNSPHAEHHGQARSRNAVRRGRRLDRGAAA